MKKTLSIQISIVPWYSKLDIIEMCFLINVKEFFVWSQIQIGIVNNNEFYLPFLNFQMTEHNQYDLRLRIFFNVFGFDLKNYPKVLSRSQIQKGVINRIFFLMQIIISLGGSKLNLI